MENTSPEITDNFMDFAYKCHQSMKAQNLSLVYEGEINQSIVKTFTALAEKNLNKSDESTKTKKTVYHVMVECMQNIVKHSDDKKQEVTNKAPEGIIIIGHDDTAYSVTTGNTITANRVTELEKILNKINNMSKEELKELYKEKMRDNTISDQGGAGLGFIDIAKKTNNKLDYKLININDHVSFFLLKININKK